MIKRALLTLALLGSFAGVASAQEGDTRTRFYNFDDLLINGAYRKPQVMYTSSRQRLRFESLANFKKDFLPRLKQTARDQALR